LLVKLSELPHLTELKRCYYKWRATVGLGEVRELEIRQPERQMINVIKDEDKYKSRTKNFQPGLWLNRITNADC